jgi:hypothetical protein
MNEQKIQPEIMERFKELPEVVQNIILESGWEKTTRRIVEENNLRIDQGGAIENEVMLTMFGFEKPENFRANITKQANLKPEQVDKIVSDINENVFQLIKDKLILETTEEKDDFEEIQQKITQQSTEPVQESREEILSEIEKVDAKPENDIISNNLKSPTITTPDSPKTIPSDPYREPVE